MKYIIENNRRFRLYVYLALVITVLCSFLIVFKALDGTRIRPVLVFTQGFDPQNIQVEKENYRPGETVYGYTSFCKNREATGTTLWAVINDKIEFYSPKTPPRELPIGCYPESQDRMYRFAIEKLAEDVLEGKHYLIGTSTLVLPRGKVIKVYYKTEVFNVIK